MERDLFSWLRGIVAVGIWVFFGEERNREREGSEEGIVLRERTTAIDGKRVI
ncbi:uncharacterized protein BDV14DRAFT_171716 [Aspergillus stella-maris]|uniref:uncharacterized protein n=1 Tax=Aspergillus stella-maris TaxID=1810926 RepID=UPI003CCE2284